ncbi:hypothetical protein ES319_D12G162900v1 [Gossypium barbadense]|uniref:Acyl-[acyl-carrier-protein] hydrolase n=2 Tax=Gossypium TaxID=3633 RepID=A0A5J5NZB1_GOSBA|nr:hypothetical protein ES319_D12G162900v1 [Gossypium barbadense]TYG41396.1 hypothetical protein ES288_D12G172000v1 [Gossypium darwinii]
MFTFSCPVSFSITCSSSNGNIQNHGDYRVNINVNGSSCTRRPIKHHTLLNEVDVKEGSTSLSAIQFLENGHISEEKIRQRIPRQKQLVDPYRQGLITERGVGYRQTVVVRSYEVGPDKTATLESLLNLFQETALNHMWMSGLLSNGFGATHGMMRNNLIWVVSRMHVQVDHYPIWGEVIEIDTWVGASGKNGMRRDWVIRSQASGSTYARATSTWVMMNEQTRRLSKMPDEVRDEISPWFIQKQAINEAVPDKIVKLDDKAKHVNSDLKPKRSDLDMNQHVNNVKYVRWMLETIPDKFLERHQLSSIILEYRRECGSSEVVQSLCQPDEDESFANGVQQNLLTNKVLVGGNGRLGSLDINVLTYGYTHLLQTQNEEIVRGRTRWNRKICTGL